MTVQRSWSLVAAIVLGILGTIGLVIYVQNAHDNAVAGEKLVSVYVASDKIPAGTRADQLASKVQEERVPTKVRAEGAVTSLNELKDRVASVDVVAGEQLLLSRFVPANTQANPVQSSVPVPAGLFQTTVSLDPDQALGGLIRAGNRVAVVSTSTAPVTGAAATADTTTAKVVARDVLVTTVQVDGKRGQTADAAQQVIDAPTGKFLVTLAVAQPDLENIVAAVNNNQGKIWLAADPGAK
jgi:pilus assembly protein CpaB